MDKRHNAALAVLDKLLTIHGAATGETWEVAPKGDFPAGRVFCSRDKAFVVAIIGASKADDKVNRRAIATGHNSQLALLTIARGQLERYYLTWQYLERDDYPLKLDGVKLDYKTVEVARKAQREECTHQHRAICTTLASIQDELAADELAALKQALEEPRGQS